MADAVKPTIWFYICEDIRQSFLAWDFGQRRGALIMALVNIIALFTLIVSIPLGFGGHEIILTPLALKIIAGIAGGWFIVLLVFITPFRMWREQRVKLNEWDATLVPQIHIVGPIEEHYPWTQPSSEKAAQRIWAIEVVNESRTHLINCSVKDHIFINKYGHPSHEIGRPFLLSSERNDDGRPHSTAFDLKGEGDRQRISICSTNETAQNAEIMMLYAIRARNLINRSVFPHWLTVRVTADNMPIPIDKSFKIFMSETGFLEMHEADDEPPPPSLPGEIITQYSTDGEPIIISTKKRDD